MLYENEEFYTPLMPFYNLYSSYTWSSHILMHIWPQWPCTFDHSDEPSMIKTCQKIYSFILCVCVCVCVSIYI